MSAFRAVAETGEGGVCQSEAHVVHWVRVGQVAVPVRFTLKVPALLWMMRTPSFWPGEFASKLIVSRAAAPGLTVAPATALFVMVNPSPSTETPGGLAVAFEITSLPVPELV